MNVSPHLYIDIDIYLVCLEAQIGYLWKANAAQKLLLFYEKIS